MIKVTGFNKSYSTRKGSFSVKNLDLTVADCTVTALLGTNGSGKSTIIKAICGVHFPNAGSIILTDSDKKEYDITKTPELAMKLAGFVPESPKLPSNMTVKDFLHFAAATHSLTGEQASRAIARTTEACALSDFISEPIKNLSKGQQQRVSFAQALIHNPPNLVLDEPISGLDPAQIIQMRKLIEELAQEKAVLMSTHILQEVYSLCKNIYIINAGQSVCNGREEDILKQTKTANLEEAFLKLSGGISE
jgi:ABC-2 type transport system ATP-binding protein